MNQNFRQILCLVDHSTASLNAARQAALIASKLNNQLHLLHVSPDQRPKNRMAHLFIETYENNEAEYYHKVDQLEKLKRELNKQYDIAITCFERRGSFIDMVKNHVKQFSIDLIVLGAKKRNWFREIAFESKVRSVIRSIDCEVLAVHADSRMKKLKKIVLPVNKFVPKRKIGIAYELAKQFTAKIHLISLNRNEKVFNEGSTEALVGSYRYLRDLTNIPIECSSVFGKNIAEAAVHYANVIDADLIVIDEGVESDVEKVAWRTGKIVNYSNVPVLSVHSLSDRLKNKYRRLNDRRAFFSFAQF